MKNKSLEKFIGFKFKIQYEDIVKKAALDTKSILMSPGVSPRSGRPGRKTPYFAGWTIEEHNYKDGYEEVVWNKTNWQLTHLLENGHYITNRSMNLIWVAPRKHIKPTYDKIKPRFKKQMEDAKVIFDFK